MRKRENEDLFRSIISYKALYDAESDIIVSRSIFEKKFINNWASVFLFGRI